MEVAFEPIIERLNREAVLNCSNCSTSTSFGSDAFRKDENGEWNPSGEIDYGAMLRAALDLGWKLRDNKVVCSQCYEPQRPESV